MKLPVFLHDTHHPVKSLRAVDRDDRDFLGNWRRKNFDYYYGPLSLSAIKRQVYEALGRPEDRSSFAEYLEREGSYNPETPVDLRRYYKLIRLSDGSIWSTSLSDNAGRAAFIHLQPARANITLDGISNCYIKRVDNARQAIQKATELFLDWYKNLSSSSINHSVEYLKSAVMSDTHVPSDEFRAIFHADEDLPQQRYNYEYVLLGITHQWLNQRGS